MEEAIISKLQAFLAGPIDSECKVVYLLVETRKVLETYPPKPTRSALLKFYCHWALHINLRHGRTTLPFLEQIEEYVSSVLEGGKNISAERRMIREFVFLDTFRHEFRTFLQAHDIPTGLCDEEPRWQEFLAHYAGVIEDGSFCCEEKNPLKLVEKVVFTRGRETPRGKVPFMLVWTISLLNGKKLKVEVASVDHKDNEIILHANILE